MTPKATLCIPTWNGGELLGRVLDAVDRQPGADQLERLAIDSGSKDDTVATLQAHGFDVTVIPQKDFDHGRTRDAMVERAQGEIAVLLTQDALPADDNWLPALLSSYDDPQVGAAYCKQIPRDDCNPFIKRRLSEWTAGKDEPTVQQCASPAEFEALEPMQRLQTCAYDNVAGSVRKAAWQDHRFGSRPFGEDVAFGKKLILAGWKIVFQARSAVIHSHNREPRDEGKRIYCDHQNLRDLFDVHLLPKWENYRDAVAWGRKEYVRMVDELDLPEARKQPLRQWARGYAHWASLGMYLGANSEQLLNGPHAARFRHLDRLLHRGIWKEPTRMEAKLDTILHKLEAIESRLARLESALDRERELAAKLRHEIDARRELGDQVRYLVDWLGEARNEVQWLKSQQK